MMSAKYQMLIKKKDELQIKLNLNNGHNIQENNQNNEINIQQNNLNLQQNTQFNNLLKNFNYENKNLKTIIVDDNIYFYGKDICIILEYKDTINAIKSHVDDEDKITMENLMNKLEDKFRGGKSPPLKHNEKQAIYINESGLYSLIFTSKKNAAKIFKKWITKDVIPSIRKTGSYNLNQIDQINNNEMKEINDNNEINEILDNAKNIEIQKF